MEVMVSEFDKLKDEAQQWASDHPEQVHEAEQAGERKLGLGGQQGQGNQQDQYGSGQQDQYGSGQQDQQSSS